VLDRLLENVQRAFSVLLLLAFAAGLATPALSPPDWLPAPLLAVVLFVACARIRSEDLDAVQPKRVLGFAFARFVLLPLGMWFAVDLVRPDLAPAALLLGMLPTGVTATAITSILRGNPALALGTTILSTVLAPLLIPTALSAVAGESVQVDGLGIGVTLGGLLFVPTALYFGLARRSPVLVEWLRTRGSPLSIVLICTIAFFVANGQRARILADPAALVGLVGMGLVFYVVAYGLGIGTGRSGTHRDTVGWAIASGNNNIVLGLTLALLHLPDQVVAFLAWDLAWITGLSLIQPVLRRLAQD
jgi:BASS family bile acid:Na+ symporter